MSVNLSPRELRSPSLVVDVETILAETGIQPDRLILEITESSAMHDPPAAMATLAALRHLGVRLALDDFGTGYSSLSHLRDFPIDMLKIAKPFVDRIDRQTDETFIDAILRLAGALGLDVVAEGIERAEQAAALRDLNCGLGGSRPSVSAYLPNAHALRSLGAEICAASDCVSRRSKVLFKPAAAIGKQRPASVMPKPEGDIGSSGRHVTCSTIA